jgi:hypothetical protein
MPWTARGVTQRACPICRIYLSNGQFGTCLAWERVTPAGAPRWLHALFIERFIMAPTDRTDIDTSTLPPPPELVPGSAPPEKPTPGKPMDHKATEYNGSGITERNETDPGTFEPQDDSPQVFEKREGPKAG